MMIHLELFSETKSWGKVASKHGMDVISVDIEEKYRPTIVADILELDYKKLPVPDLITASPPCNSFSTLARAGRMRDWYTLEPMHPNAILGNKLLKKTIEIIRYFQKKNPKLLFVIENPRAMMARMSVINRIPRQTIEYCLYGEKWRKSTDMWHNFPGGLDLKDPLTKACDGLVPVVEIPLLDRYRIPKRLIEIIFRSFDRDYGNPPLPVSLRDSNPIQGCNGNRNSLILLKEIILSLDKIKLLPF